MFKESSRLRATAHKRYFLLSGSYNLGKFVNHNVPAKLVLRQFIPAILIVYYIQSAHLRGTVHPSITTYNRTTCVYSLNVADQY